MREFDPDDYVERFCKRSKCDVCNGSDENGEPNGYGCTALDAYIQYRYEAYIKRNKTYDRQNSGRVCDD